MELLCLSLIHTEKFHNELDLWPEYGYSCENNHCTIVWDKMKKKKRCCIGKKIPKTWLSGERNPTIPLLYPELIGRLGLIAKIIFFWMPMQVNAVAQGYKQMLNPFKGMQQMWLLKAWTLHRFHRDVRWKPKEHMPASQELQ